MWLKIGIAFAALCLAATIIIQKNHSSSYSFLRSRSISDIIKHLEKEIFLTLSKLDISEEDYRSIETYVSKMSINYLQKGVQPQLKRTLRIQPKLKRAKVVSNLSWFDICCWAVCLIILITLLSDHVIWIIILLLIGNWHYTRSLNSVLPQSIDSLNSVIPESFRDNCHDQSLVHKLSILLYTLEQIYSLPKSKDVYSAIKSCPHLIESDRLEILKILNS